MSHASPLNVRSRMIQVRDRAHDLGLALLVASGVSAGSSLASGIGQATQPSDQGARAPASQPSDAGATRRNEWLTEGVVRAIDRQTGRAVLRHGPIANLGIPAMTMSFRVIDPRAFDTIEPGTPVRFAADRVSGVFTIVYIERLFAPVDTTAPPR